LNSDEVTEGVATQTDGDVLLLTAVELSLAEGVPTKTRVSGLLCTADRVHAS
jgi:hypothetical protein